MLEICLLGTGGMMPLPNRWLTALLARYNGSELLIDCGEGTQVALKKAGYSANPIDIICITHFHADHVSGLPGFLLTMGNADRIKPLTIIGPRGIRNVVESLRVIAPDLPFEIEFIELLQPYEEIRLNGYLIKAFRLNHNVPCYGYTLEIERAGRFDAQKAKELGIPLNMWSRLQKGETLTDGENVFTPDMVMGPARKGIKFTYCTDTRPTPAIVENAKGSDLFVCEGMYGEEDKLQKAREHKHMTMYEAAEIAREAAVKEMWLTHYSPSLSRPDEYADKVRKIFENTVISKDGRNTVLRFEGE